MIVDMHTHYHPRGFVEAAKKGRSWYGWRVVQDNEGRQLKTYDESISRYHPNSDLLDPMKRIQGRTAEQGIDFEALIIIGTMFNYQLPPREGAAFCREVNEELSELQKSHPGNFRGLGLLPMQDTGLAIRELEHAVKDLGLTSFTISSSVYGKNLDDPAILPVLEEIATADVTVTCHPPLASRAGEERLPRYYFANSFGAPLESSLAVMSVIYSGLLDRHPNLRISFTHGGGWVQYGVGRFTLRYYQREDARPMASPPADYLRRMYYDCLIHDVDSLQLLVKRVGADKIMIGTDYPAGGDIPGGAVNWIKAQEWLSDDDKENILWRNASRFLGLPAG